MTEEKILDLPLKKKWYDMIESGIKKEEYREIKPYWEKRFFRVLCFDCTKHYKCDLAFEYGYYAPLSKKNKVRFRYGYTKKTMTFEIKDMIIGRGKSEWGAPTDKDVFIIKLGERIK